MNSYGRLSNKLIFEALDLIQQYLIVAKSADQSAGFSVQASEDSQDYGDWSGFDDIVIRDDQKAAAEVWPKFLSFIFIFNFYTSSTNNISDCLLLYMKHYIGCFPTALVTTYNQKIVY